MITNRERLAAESKLEAEKSDRQRVLVEYCGGTLVGLAAVRCARFAADAAHLDRGCVDATRR